MNISDQRWVCNICLLLWTSKMSISTAWPIVQCNGLSYVPKSKVAQSVSEWVSEWQCHPLSCQTLVWTAKNKVHKQILFHQNYELFARHPHHIQPFFARSQKAELNTGGIESLKYFSPTGCSTVTAVKTRGGVELVVMEGVEWTNWRSGGAWELPSNSLPNVHQVRMQQRRSTSL